MMRPSLVFTAALVSSLVAQSPLESTFANPAPGFQVTATPSPITGLFDFTANTDIILSQIDVQSNTAHGTNGQLGLYLTAAGGTHVGNQQNAAAWTQVTQVSQVHAGGRVQWVLNPPVAIAAGTYGVAMHFLQANPVYHGGAVSPTLPQQYSNTEMTFDMSTMRFRISDPVDPFGGAAAGFSPRQGAVAFHYTTDTRYADFTATPRTGTSPLQVQFDSIVATSAPGGIQLIQWDFDNDGQFDDFTADPLHTYTQCGTYTVTMELVDALGVATVTKTDFIVTDVIDPTFSATLLGGTAMQFNDTSAMPAQTWDWDLDGDGIFGDANVANPTFVYPSGCTEVAVSMTVSRACTPPVTETKTILIAQPIESTFQSGLITATGATNSANYLDVNITNPKGVTICGMHVNSSVAVGSPVTVNIYQTEGTYVGKTGDATLWRLVGTAAAISEGTGGRTLATFNPPIHLATGSYGLCMEHVGASPVYTNLFGTQVYSTADMTMTLGASQTIVFDPASAPFSPRIANLAIYYTTTQTNSTAGYGYIGSGCVGTAGVPTNVALTQPVLGTSATTQIGNIPLGVAVAAIGFTRVPPLDLVIIGMGGCNLHHTADATITLIGAPGSLSYSLPIPNNPVFVGAQLYNSAITFDPAINAFGFAISDAAVMLMGL